MQTNQKPRQTSVLLYIIIGLFIGLLIAVAATLVSLYFSGSEITVNSFFNLQFLNPLFLLLDLYALFLALLFGLVALQRNKTAQAQAQYQRMNQKRSAEVQQLNERMQKEENKFKDLEVVISRGKQEWEATFDAVKDLIILTDEQGKILRCNRTTGEAFQTGFSQVIGKQIDQLFLGITGDGEGKIPLEEPEIHFPTLDGWYSVSRTFLKLDDQEGGWVYVFRDVSDRKRAMLDLQRLNQYYEQLVKNNPIAIITLNQEDRIVDCNPAFEKIFGFEKRQVMGRDLDGLISPLERESETRELTERVRQGETVHQLTQRKAQNGQLVDVEVYGFPVILGGRQIGSLALYHDVSELFRMERDSTVPSQAIDTGEWLPEGNLEALKEEEIVQTETTPLDEPVIIGEPEPEIPTAETIEAQETAKTGEVELSEELGSIETGEAATGEETEIETTQEIEAGEKIETVQASPKRTGLMRIPGMEEDYRKLLEKAGIHTVEELSNRNPNKLQAALVVSNEMYHQIPMVPPLPIIENWVKSAKELEPLAKD